MPFVQTESYVSLLYRDSGSTGAPVLFAAAWALGRVAWQYASARLGLTGAWTAELIPRAGGPSMRTRKRQRSEQWIRMENQHDPAVF
jgi:hypothetical protein